MNAPGLHRRASSSHLYSVKGGGVVFDPDARQLFALNPSAAYIWLCLSQGLQGDELTGAFARAFGIDRGAAEQAVEQAITAFHAIGGAAERLSPLEPASAAALLVPNGQTAIYQFLDRNVVIQGPEEIIVDVDNLLPGRRNHQRTRSPDLVISVTPRGGGLRIRSGRETVDVASKSEVLAELERILVQDAVRSTPHWLTFHAACLSKARHSILLTGPSGSGKTTLSAVLARYGWLYGSDELTMLEPPMRWRPVPIPPCIKSQNFPTIQNWYPALQDVASHKRYGNTVKYLPLETAEQDGNVRTIIFPTYDTSQSSELQPLEALDGLSRLLKQCVYMADSFDRTAVEQLLAWHESARYLTLRYDDAETAVAAVTRLFGQGC